MGGGTGSISEKADELVISLNEDQSRAQNKNKIIASKGSERKRIEIGGKVSPAPASPVSREVSFGNTAPNPINKPVAAGKPAS